MGPLITTDELAARLEGGAPTVLFDCRFSLAEPELGRRQWLEAHIPGAMYAHLDDDLSSPVRPGTGRHPLPEAGAFAEFLALNGWQPGVPVVAYDAQGGAMAARLWWLMKYFGGHAAAVLDGGWNAWLDEDRPTASGHESAIPATPISLSPRPELVLGADGVARALDQDEITLLDARGAERFRGDTEPLDRKAGHVPGARNRPFSGNLDEHGRFKPAETLRKEFVALGDRAPHDVVHMCGSGVTACHNLLAMEVAGLTGSQLFPGSWSEWVDDRGRPVATGKER
ncbi:MAG: sulfurtransferase [Xanthomonadales bacterium]|nr:sulfurtransferase [Xanthomonadales bacterium]